jgi:hypothetical protein
MSSDSEARFDELLALISNAEAPLNPEYVAHEALACAEQGATAARFAAVVNGAGFGCAQDWSAALYWLGQAAERGDAQARAEFAVLTPGAVDGWAEHAARFDAAAWTAARATRAISAHPRIGQADAFLEAPVCAWLIERARTQLTRAKVYGAGRRTGVVNEVRTNSSAEFSIANLDVVMLLVRARIANTLAVAPAHLERAAVFHYAVGQRFGAHPDYLDPSLPHYAADIARRGQRVATFLVYLNDAFDGGETRFVELQRNLRPPAGGALFFYNVDERGAPEPLSLHEGLAPTRGEKWLLSQFVRDKPQSGG